METAREFALSGELVDSALDLMLEGHSIPHTLFNDIMVEKCQLINHHFCNTRDHLRIVASITNIVATVKFHDTALEDSKLKIITLSNTSDLKDQLVHLWTMVQELLKHYHEDDRIAELASIDTYYRYWKYDQMMADLLII